MKTNEPEVPAGAAVLDIIRVETALSRFPIHRLAKTKKAVPIAIRETDTAGELSLHWEVGHHSKYGPPGQLAYKLDTRVVNRRIEEVGRPIPGLIRLGSLTDLCRELDLADSGKNRRDIKRALRQNAFAGITAKIRYKTRDRAELQIEIDDTRYGVVMTGETLSNGRKADAVYLVLHDFFRKILDTSPVRPLDYGYLRSLPPGSQRLYELLSFPIFGTLNRRGPWARMRYSEFCTYAPQRRYEKLWEVKKQMGNLHTPHLKSGYLVAVEYQATTDREGHPDWMMIYTPGKKAKEEFTRFTSKGGPVTPQAELSLTEVVEVEVETPPEPEPEPTGLVAELVVWGVTRDVAAELVQEFEAGRIRRQIEGVEWRRRRDPKAIKDVGAYLTEAIRTDYPPPAEMVEGRKRAEQAAERERQEGERHRLRSQDQAIEGRIRAFWEGLSPEEQAQVMEDAVSQADPETRATCASGSPSVRRLARATVRKEHIRRLLDLPPTS